MFAKSHTHILYFTKSDTGFTFNATTGSDGGFVLEDVPVPARSQTLVLGERVLRVDLSLIAGERVVAAAGP